MSKGVNKVILIGNLGADPEGFGTAVKLKLATSESWKDKDGNMAERTEWHQVTLFSRLGEIAKQYLAKGSKVYIEGSIRTSKYTDKNGVDKYNTEIIASNLQMLDSKNTASSSPQQGHEPQAKSNYDYMAVKHQQANGQQATSIDDSLDDLPF